MSAQHPAPARFTLNDLLNLNLPPHARAIIYRELAACGNTWLAQTRLACRSLRAIIDEHADAVCLRAWCLDEDLLDEEDVSLAWMEALCVSWHQRWPRAGKLTLELEDTGERVVSCLPRPFAIAPPEGFQRLTHLLVRGDDDNGVYTIGASLAELLQRVRGVQTLALAHVFVRLRHSSPLDRALASSAFSSLTRLEHLTLTDYHWLPCIQPGLAAQLKTITVGNGVDPARKQLDEDEVVRAVARMTALEELVLDEDVYYSAEGLRAVLDALAPSVRRLRVVGACLGGRSDFSFVAWDCTLAGGKLLSVVITSHMSEQDYVEDVAAFLEAALLPSRALGPRLPRLHLDLTVDADEETPEALTDLSPDIWGLAARCDELQLLQLIAAGSDEVSLEDVVAIARLLGMPQCLDWGFHTRMELSPRRHAAAVTSAGGGGSEASGFDANSPALTPDQAAPRALERAMQRATAEAAGGPHLLLSGPAVTSRLALPRELRAWVKGLSAQAAEGLPPQPPHFRPMYWFRRLPACAAIELWCDESMAAAVAEAARRAGAAVRAVCCSTCTALHKVLQGLWSGEEAGGPGADVGELERFRWLLETMEAAAALLPPRESL
ncbi:hypothetical protein HYH03_010135 [Edaphochlamys debaryana]|uniref:Uncharacterized protein n=1 Tax=Edaphochlamys debaryana TaxID=47281 RepID=A0A835XUU5_9CHLO|nr:hypothetical protein HYH03_010135 [Edaphochlamys debaryana]|eukprot:KAG2491567.1 hypothetical protein HYH03_010135 [Edaphochlamys debaryana]